MGELMEKSREKGESRIQIDYKEDDVKIMQMSFTSEWDLGGEQGYN